MSSNESTFEIRLKNNGKIFSRHYKAGNAKQATRRVKGKGKILFIRKVHPWDIVGTIDSMQLKSIIGITPRDLEERRKNVVINDTTLDSIVFPKKASSPRKSNWQKNKKEV